MRPSLRPCSFFVCSAFSPALRRPSLPLPSLPFPSRLDGRRGNGPNPPARSTRSAPTPLFPSVCPQVFLFSSSSPLRPQPLGCPLPPLLPRRLFHAAQPSGLQVQRFSTPPPPLPCPLLHALLPFKRRSATASVCLALLGGMGCNGARSLRRRGGGAAVCPPKGSGGAETTESLVAGDPSPPATGSPDHHCASFTSASPLFRIPSLSPTSGAFSAASAVDPPRADGPCRLLISPLLPPWPCSSVPFPRAFPDLSRSPVHRVMRLRHLETLRAARGHGTARRSRTLCAFVTRNRRRGLAWRHAPNLFRRRRSFSTCPFGTAVFSPRRGVPLRRRVAEGRAAESAALRFFAPRPSLHAWRIFTAGEACARARAGLCKPRSRNVLRVLKGRRISKALNGAHPWLRTRAPDRTSLAHQPPSAFFPRSVEDGRGWRHAVSRSSRRPSRGQNAAM